MNPGLLKIMRLNEVLLVIRVICVPLCVGDFSFEIVQMPIDRIVAAVSLRVTHSILSPTSPISWSPVMRNSME